MRKKKTIPKNHLAELIAAANTTASAVAQEAEITESYMSKLINHQKRVTPELAATFAEILNTDPHKVVDLPINMKFMATCDEGLLSSSLTWISEAAKKDKITLTTEKLSHWATYVYKNALEQKLNFNQTKFLAYAVIDIIQQEQK